MNMRAAHYAKQTYTRHANTPLPEKSGTPLETADSAAAEKTAKRPFCGDGEAIGEPSPGHTKHTCQWCADGGGNRRNVVDSKTQPRTNESGPAPDGWCDTPEGKARLAELLVGLCNLRNELDSMTFGSSQKYRAALYPLNDCLEILEEARK